MDLDAATLYCAVSFSGWNRGELSRLPMKTSRSGRTLAMPPSIICSMREHRRRFEDRLVAGSPWHDAGYVFTTSSRATIPAPSTPGCWKVQAELGDPCQTPTVVTNDVRYHYRDCVSGSEGFAAKRRAVDEQGEPFSQVECLRTSMLFMAHFFPWFDAGGDLQAWRSLTEPASAFLCGLSSA